MMIKIAACLLTGALFASCETTATTTTRTTTATTTSREKLADRVLAKRIASNSPALPDSTTEPAAPGAGPEDIATDDPEAGDPARNPALMPTPLLRYSASSRTP